MSYTDLLVVSKYTKKINLLTYYKKIGLISVRRKKYYTPRDPYEASRVGGRGSWLELSYPMYNIIFGSIPNRFLCSEYVYEKH